MALAGYGDRLEGIHAVSAAVGANRVTELWVEAARLRHPQVMTIVDEIRRTGGRVHEVDDLSDIAETEAPQGIVARARPIQSISLESMIEGHDNPALMVLDHLVDPHNVGAIARSARAAALHGLVVSGRRAAPLSATAFKAAAGALEDLAVTVVNSIADALARLHKRGVWTVGLDAEGDQSLFGLDLLSQPVAVVVGQEGIGLSRLVKERCEVLAAIPLAGHVESLNASVAAALAAFEIRRVREKSHESRASSLE